MLTDQNPDAVAAGAEEPPRVKLLCSFGGSILPRPLDGKLRYVGGETRIVALPRSASYDDFMARMKELFDGAWAIKYQQPDEDLDALVSVVNDDDVVNMMEEYDKLGSTGEGFTRLRVFLFAHPSDHDASLSPMSSPQFEVDERETERRYVDALNSLSDSKPISPDSNAADVGMHGHQFGTLHRLTIPRLPSHGQIFNEMDGSWSPAGPAAYYSPGNLTPREFPPSPSAGRFHVGGIGDLSDRVQEEYNRHSPAYYEHGSSFVENTNVVWLPPGGLVGEMAGFPGNLGHTHGVYEGGSAGVCEDCLLAFQKNQNHVDARHHDPSQMHGQLPHIGGNEYSSQFSNSCADCVRERESYFKDRGMYANEHVEHYPPFFNDFHGRDRSWTAHHQPSHHPDMMRGHRNEYFVDASGMPLPSRHGGLYNGHSSIPRDDPHYSRLGSELHSGAYREQNSAGAMENAGVRYGNNDSPYVTESPYQMPHNFSSIHGSKRNMQGSMLPSPSYDVAGSIAQFNYVRGDQSQSALTGHNGNTLQKIHPVDGIQASEYHHDHAFKAKLNITESQSAIHEPPLHDQSRRLCYNDPTYAESVLPLQACLVEGRSRTAYPCYPVNGGNFNAGGRAMVDKYLIRDSNEMCQPQVEKEPSSADGLCPKETINTDLKSNSLTCFDEVQTPVILSDPNESDLHPNKEGTTEYSNFLTKSIPSVKEAVLDGAKEIKSRTEADSIAHFPLNPFNKESSLNESVPKNMHKEIDSDGEQPDISKIEPTSAEMDALAKGLQVIKNDDLEELKELGNGAYGSVYHGKWRGSDVAIKRIKSSCFSGKPSERERLIADFWKEACILSSLHHPNVVSFYGVVRDGCDGTLATVTEFMVNGSLKQFLQKKDRTIDRRKRLIIAMDAAFGMEYLHGKNVVHFDLKCENLLVNMRDPHRPVCKIGDLGLSKVKQQTLVSGGVRGTIPWMAPELLSGKSDMVTEKVDVYSFGIVMWELLTGEDPYTNMHFASIIGGIVNSTLRPQVPVWCDPEWKALMENCWSSDPGERPSFSEISQKLRKIAASINVK